MSCPSCGEEKSTSEFTGTGIVMCCMGCNCRYPVKTEPVYEPDNDDSGDEEIPPVVVDIPKRAPATTVEPATKPLTAKGIVQQARIELRQLNAEIKRLEKLKKQRDEVMRLLDAAKKPVVEGLAKVRPIRTQTGR